MRGGSILDDAWDALCIGGGPAGSSAAAYLARAGRRVLVLERARFPRPHIGESLLPGVLDYLDALGVRDQIERAGFERKDGQTFHFRGSPWSIDFRELDAHSYAFFVDRARFDEILLRHAESSGAVVLEECQVTRVIFERGRATGVSFKGPDGKRQTVRARFVIDASGQAAVVARGAGLRRYVRGLKNVAFWSYFEGAKRPEGDARRHIVTAGVPEGWIWVIPLGDRTSVGIVTSRASNEAREGLGIEAWFEKTIRLAPPIWALLDGARRVTPIEAAKDWSYRARRTSGPGVLLAGDAAHFIDPILSTGVHLAMSSAYWAAATVLTSLDDPAREPFYRRFYDETIGATYRELLAQVKAFYRVEGDRDGSYWASKRILRAGARVAGDKAFLFITAGLLRNAGGASPHDPLATATTELEPSRRASSPAVRAVSPRLVFRSKRGDELVTVHADGLRLSIVRHTPRGLRDRPPGSFCALELADADREPVAALVVSEGASGLEVDVVKYAERVLRSASIADILAAARAILSPIEPGFSRKRIAEARGRLRRELPVRLPKGLELARRPLRGGGVAEPELTVVLAAPAPIDRVYFVATARVPIELAELPMLRTRFLDVSYRPERVRDGRRLVDIPEIAELFARIRSKLASALRGAPSLARAFAIVESEIAALAEPPFRLIASGRLGEGGT